MTLRKLKDLKRIELSKATNAYALLDDVAKTMEEEPRRVDMGNWLQRILTKTFKPSDWIGGTTRSAGLTGQRRTYISAPDCGTVGCIAGWMRALTAPITPSVIAAPYFEVKIAARNMLSDGSLEMERDIEYLFHGSAHVGERRPYPFPEHRVGTKAYVRDVVANIRKFQAKWEAQLRAKSLS